VEKNLSIVPADHSGSLLQNNTVIYSNQGSTHMVVTVLHADHPAYVVKEMKEQKLPQ
jgi:hypothetical protein